MSIRIAITDDHPAIRDGIRAMLQHIPRFEVSALYASGNALLAGLRKSQPDVLLLDIHLPDSSGNELAEIIVRDYPGVHIIILTSIDSVYIIKSLLNTGVKGYLLKTSGQELLAEAIEAVAGGAVFLPREIQSLIVESTLNPMTGISKSQPVLTAKETEILKLIAEEYTSQEISRKMFLSVRTVDGYRLGLMKKLDVKNLAGLVRKAILMGIVK